jgi:hypothetical protein
MPERGERFGPRVAGAMPNGRVEGVFGLVIGSITLSIP